MRVLEQRREALGAALQAGVAPHRRARLAARGGGDGPLGESGLWLRGLGLAEARERSAAAEHEALRERVRREAGGAVQAGGRAPAHGREAPPAPPAGGPGGGGAPP